MFISVFYGTNLSILSYYFNRRQLSVITKRMVLFSLQKKMALRLVNHTNDVVAASNESTVAKL
jgi:hypothetical protein